MKKALVLLLALAMVLPMALTQPVKAEDEVTVKPFYTLGWSDFDQESYPYLDGLYQLNFTYIGDRIKLSSIVHSSDDFDAQVLEVAQTLKTAMDKRPAGARYLHTWAPAKAYRMAVENALFFDEAVNQMTDIMDALLKTYKEIGGQLDGIVVDLEYVGLSVYYLVDTDGGEYQPNSYLNNPDLLRQIVADPRYTTEIRPLLEEWGFIFYEADTPEKQASYTELYSIMKNAGSKYSRSRNVWNTVMRIHLNNTLTKWAYEPLVKYFPEANMSDYQSMDSATWLKMTSVTDDGTEMNGGNSVAAGDTSTTSYYYGQPNKDYYEALSKYTGYNEAILPAEPFTQLMYYVNFTRYMYESSDTKKIAPWITYYDYGTETSYRINSTAYYTEELYHLGMFDPQPFLSYTYVGDSVFSDGRASSTHYKEIQQVKNDIMAELTRVAGYSDRQPIYTDIDWNSDYILTGMYANGRNIWRITPNTAEVSLADFKVSDSDPTFSVGGKTVTFPGGKIIEDTEISILGSCGYWVETAADVTPVVTTDADHYEKYPSLLYDFEEYADGSFDYNTSLPTNAWGFTWKKFGDIKGASTIVTVDGNKKLSIIGNSANWIKGLPSNITAGDTYAEDQTWQITVTIPEGLSEDAVITVLNYEGNKQEIDDGAFKIQNGKLYYATGEEDEEYELVFEEMMDIAPGTYTFKREMNFNHATPYSTYIVLDASGKELKKVENVPSPAFNYITTIGFAVEETDTAVLFDDFKIYLTGTAADFGIYDAKTGQDATLNETRDSSTAYRLSWLNATAKEETAVIKADITSGGKTETKVIKEIKMIPGTDGIETGIVEISEGQTVKVYLETTIAAPVEPNQPGETEPTVTPTETPEETQAPTEATEAPVATEATQAPTVEPTVAPTETTVANKRPTAVKVSRPTQEAEVPEETEPVEEPTEAPTKAPTVATAPVEEPTEVTEATEIPEETLAPTEETLAPTEETQAPTEATEAPEATEATQAPTEAPGEEDKGGNTVLIIVIVVVVLAAAGAAVYFFVIKKKK